MTGVAGAGALTAIACSPEHAVLDDDWQTFT